MEDSASTVDHAMISLDGSLAGWQLMKSPALEGVTPLEDSLVNPHFQGAWGKDVLIGNEKSTSIYSLSGKKEVLEGTVRAIFQEAIFLQTSSQLIHIRFVGEKMEKKVIEQVSNIPFFPLSETQLLYVERASISLWAEDTCGFKRVWQVSRDKVTSTPCKAEIVQASVLYIETLDQPFSYRYSYFNLTNGEKKGPASISTPYLWPLSGERFLWLVKTEEGFFLEIDHSNKKTKTLKDWETLDTVYDIEWIDSNADWVLLRIGDKTAVIQITSDQERFIGILDSANGILYGQDQALFHTCHTFHIHQLSNLECVRSISLDLESFYPDMEEFAIQGLQRVYNGYMALVKGYAKGRSICSYLKQVDTAETKTPLNTSEAKRSLPPSPSISREKKPLEGSRSYLLPSGGIAVTTTDHLTSYDRSGKRVVSLRCHPLQVKGDRALVKVDNRLEMHSLSEYNKKRIPLPTFPFGAAILEDSFILAGGGYIALYSDKGQELAKYKGPSSEESVLKAYASDGYLYLITRRSQEGLFEAYLYDRQKDYTLIKCFSLSHVEVYQVEDTFLWVEQTQDRYLLRDQREDYGIELPFKKDFKWLGGDGSWVAARCDETFYLINRKDRKRRHVLEGYDGVSLLGQGLLAMRKGKEIKIAKVGEWRAFQTISPKGSTRGVFLHEDTLLCLIKKEMHSFETERFPLKLPPNRSIHKYKVIASGVLVGAITLFVYYRYSRWEEKKGLSPPPLSNPPATLPPLPKRVPVKIQPPPRNAGRI